LSIADWEIQATDPVPIGGLFIRFRAKTKNILEKEKISLNITKNDIYAD